MLSGLAPAMTQGVVRFTPGCLGDTQFSFRFRQCGGPRTPWHSEDRLYDSGVPPWLQVSISQSEDNSWTPTAVSWRVPQADTEGGGGSPRDIPVPLLAMWSSVGLAQPLQTE